MKKIAILAAGAAALIATPAMAQDDSEAGGAFIGVVGGWDKTGVDDGVDTGSTDGVLYGINASYDTVTGNALFGIEAEVTDSTAGVTDTDVVIPGDSASIDAGRDLYAGVRLGYVIEDDTVIYLKGGYSNARIAFEYEDGTGNEVEFGENLDGLRLGAGVETELAGLTARFEYRYSEYEDVNLFGTDLSIEHNQVSVTLGKKF